VAVVQVTAGAAPDRPAGQVTAQIVEYHAIVHQLLEAVEKSGYQLEKLLAAVWSLER